MKKVLTILCVLTMLVGGGSIANNSPEADSVNIMAPDTLSSNPLSPPQGGSVLDTVPKSDNECQVLDRLATLYFDSIHQHKDTGRELYQNWGQIEESFINDSVMAQRVYNLNTDLDLAYNRHVKRWIQVYTIERRELTEKVLGLKDHYYPLFEEVLRKHDMPLALKHLSIVESALNPAARSWMGATGLWQFMYGTALMYDMEINYYVDERSDPFVATETAVRYLKDLHREFGDWMLVIAAYNCGPGKVRRAIRYSGGSRDYWEIRKHLPRETRGYVPAFIAVNYVMTHYEAHQLVPKNFEGELPVISNSNVGLVTVQKRLDLETLSRLLDTSEETLSFLNPDLKKDLVPNLSTPYTLQLPCDKVPIFNQKEDTIYQVAEKVMDNKLGTEERRITYRVRWGDNLGSIASRYNCTVREIMRWNGLHSTRIHPNQRLHIYLQGHASKNTQKTHETASTKGSESSTKEESKQEQASSAVPYDPFSEYLYHEVKRGDTLWEIAREYPDITVEDLKDINNLSSGYELKPGMILKIKLSG